MISALHSFRPSCSSFNCNSRFTKERVKQQQDELREQLAEIKQNQEDTEKRAESYRSKYDDVQKEIAAGDGARGTIHNNLRYRKLQNDVVELTNKMDAVDIEEYARNRRVFEEQWKIKKEQEDNMSNRVRVEFCLVLDQLVNGVL